MCRINARLFILINLEKPTKHEYHVLAMMNFSLFTKVESHAWHTKTEALEADINNIKGMVLIKVSFTHKDKVSWIEH